MPEIRIREHRNFIKTKSSEESAQKAANEQAAETAQENAAEIVRKYPHKPQPYAKQQPRISEGHPFAQGRSAFRQELRRKMAAQQRRTAVQISHMAGKTGTAQNPHGEDHSIFMAFAPKDDPQIAISVYVENSGFGATWAVPIASLMIEKYLHRSIDPSRLEIEKRMIEKSFY